MEQVRDDFFMRSIKKSSRTCVVRDELAERMGSLFCGKATAVAACHQEPPFESHPRQGHNARKKPIRVDGLFSGGAGGIRTHGTVAGTPDFESGPL